MIHTLINVRMDGEQAGLFDLHSQVGDGRFEWYADFENGNSLLTNAFYNEENKRFASFDPMHTLPSPFLDYLPGKFARKLLEAALRNSPKTVDDLTSLAWLSLTGNRGMGAFSFDPVGYPELAAVESVDLDKMVTAASVIWNKKGRELSERRLRELLRCALTSRGVSPKLLLAVNEFNGSVMSGQADIPANHDAWIVKLDGIETGSANKLQEEYRYSKLAENAGIRVTDHRMLHDGSLKHLMIRRFDRDGALVIPHFSFACWARENTCWEIIFSKMRSLRMAFPDMEEMYRRMCFIYLTNNRGFSTSSICFLYNKKSGWSLASGFNMHPDTAPLSYKIGLLNQFDSPTPGELIAFGKSVSIRRASKILNQIQEVIQ